MSSHRKAVQIEAESEDEARKRAAKFDCAAAPAGSKRFDPWSQPTLARAKVIATADPAVPFRRLSDQP